MKIDLNHVLADMNDDLAAGRLTGLVVLATYKGSKIRMLYTDHIALHPAPVIGYLLALCHDLVALLKR